jgi:SAM-dependent methyltransferase
VRPLYHSFAWAYDLLVRPSGPAPEATARLFAERGLRPGAAVVDAGCGTGDHAIELDRAGFAATGIDTSPELIEQARTKARRARSGAAFHAGDLRTWEPPTPCAGVLCRGVLNDLLADEDRQAALAGLARMLEPGGLLVLDVRDWDASAARYESAPVVERSAEVPDGTLTFRSETTLRPADRALLVHERLALGARVEEFDFAMRCWTPEEVRQRARAAGFVGVELLDDRGGARADRIVALATRRKGRAA